MRTPLTLSLVLALVTLLTAACAQTDSTPAPLPTVAPAPTIAPAPAAQPTTAVAPAVAAIAAQTAPPFSLESADGRQVALSGLLEQHEAVVLVFYRGFF